jgi:phage tail-like protein
MPNRRDFDRLNNHNFKVEIQGVTMGPFLAVEGMESLTEVLVTRDGDSPLVRKQPGKTSYPNIVLRRGFSGSDELWVWRKQTADGKTERKSGSIIILDKAGGEIMRFNFFEAWPCSWRLSQLDANGSELLVEELEIVVEKIERG